LNFKPGNTVKFIHTGEIGEVVEIIDHESILVDLDGDEIPTDIENVVLWKDDAIYNPFQQSKTISKVPKSPVEIKPKVLKTPNNEGLLVAFEPDFDNEGNINRFIIFLVNDTPYKVIYNFKIKVKEYFTPEKNDIVDSLYAKKIGELSQYDLSDNPNLLFSFWQVTTEGTEHKVEKTIKIKPKQFFKKDRNLSFTVTPCYTYELLKEFSNSKEEGLQAYTKRHISEEKEDEFYVYVKAHELYKIEDFAEFPTEIDLHIEKLITDHDSLSSAEKLKLQLQVFDEYMEQAIHLGVPKVNIIHGLGTGRLREIIKKRLDRNEYVKMSQNVYHHKYGFGATEVFLN
jgi:hypothetical protein